MEALFPSRCIGCEQIGTFLCHNCITVIPPAELPSDTSIRAIWSYQHNTVRHLIWNIKYNNVRAAAPICAKALWDTLGEDMAEEILMGAKSRVDNILVVPIPLSRARLQERGYNHTEDVARAIVALATDNRLVLVTDILVKVRDTKPQMSLPNRTERLHNLIYAFSVSDTSRVAGHDIILIDDVTTTGATIAEARKTLLAAGARSVKAYVVAH